jgi:hypothetical protein
MTECGPERSKPPDGNHQPKRRAQVLGAAVLGSASRGPRRMLLIVLGACLCVAAAGVAVAVFASPGGGSAGQVAGPDNGQAAPANTPGAQPAALPPSSPSTSRPQPPGSGLAKSVLRWPPRLNRQIRRWEAGPGGKALAAVEEQMGTAMQSASLRLYPSMKLSCAGLASQISTAQAGPPIPDAAMQRQYARALSRLSRAAADCRSAISVDQTGDESEQTHVNGPLLKRSRLEFAEASATLYRAIGAIESLGR